MTSNFCNIYYGYSVDKMLSGGLTNSELKIEDFDLGMVLGEGGFGKVYLAHHKVSGFIVGLKSLKRPEPTDQDASIMLKREVQFHHDSCHPNVLKMHNLFFDKDRVYIILEYATGGCLRDIILPLSKQCAAKYILDLSKAIALCHAHDIIHRDIKPDNFLLGCDGRIKISDFGVSAQDSPVLPCRTCVGTRKLSNEHSFILLRQRQPGPPSLARSTPLLAEKSSIFAGHHLLGYYWLLGPRSTFFLIMERTGNWQA